MTFSDLVRMQDDKFARICVVMDFLNDQPEFKSGEYYIPDDAVVHGFLDFFDALCSKNMKRMQDSFRKLEEDGLVAKTTHES